MIVIRFLNHRYHNLRKAADTRRYIDAWWRWRLSGYETRVEPQLSSNLLEFKLSQKSVDSSYSCPSPTMMQSISHENAFALGANGTSGIVTRSRVGIPSMGGLSTTKITIPPSNKVDQEDSALLVAFSATTETVASANGAIRWSRNVEMKLRDLLTNCSKTLEKTKGSYTVVRECRCTKICRASLLQLCQTQQFFQPNQITSYHIISCYITSYDMLSNQVTLHQNKTT